MNAPCQRPRRGEGAASRAASVLARARVSNRSELRPLFASKNDPSDGAETGGAEPHIAEQSRSWRAASGEREVMRGF